MANYLVTGGAGFLGSNLVRKLLAQGDSVTVFDSLTTGRRENISGLEGDLTFVKGDIRDTSALLEILASKAFDCIFHLAAIPSVKFSFENPQEAHDVNATGTLCVLAVARAVGCPKVVFASSCAVYGDKTAPPISETAQTEPLSPYAAQKVLGENYCLLYSSFLGVPSVVLRFFNIYGPRQDPGSDYAAVVPKFLTRILNGKPPVIYGDGKQTRDFVFVKDAVNVCIAAAKSAKAEGKIINIGSGVETTINKLAAIVTTMAGAGSKPTYAGQIQGEVHRSCADISTARNRLGFFPETLLEEGLDKTLDFYKSGKTSPEAP